MALFDLNTDPSSSTKRWFGASLSTLLLIVAYLVQYRAANVSMILAIAGVMVAVVYYAVPGTRVRLIRAWQYATYPVAWVISHLLLGTVFFGIVLPTGIVLRLLGYDPLRLKKRNSKSNWMARGDAPEISRYFKQF
ncbi:SxtJ family membrane protein [Novipirellula caenicola]